MFTVTMCYVQYIVNKAISAEKRFLKPAHKLKLFAFQIIKIKSMQFHDFICNTLK